MKRKGKKMTVKERKELNEMYNNLKRTAVERNIVIITARQRKEK